MYLCIYNSIESVNDFYSTDYNKIYLCNNINHCARYVDYKIIIVIKDIVHGMYRFALYLDFYLPIGTRLFNQGVRKSFEIPILIK